MTIELYPCRYRDPLTRRWVRGRYKASKSDLAARYAEWEVIGPPETRKPLDAAFTPIAPPVGKPASGVRLGYRCPRLTEKAYTTPTWTAQSPNKNGLPEGKPLICLVAGEGFEPSTFGL
jgi:hypothetical protein